MHAISTPHIRKYVCKVKEYDQLLMNNEIIYNFIFLEQVVKQIYMNYYGLAVA